MAFHTDPDEGYQRRKTDRPWSALLSRPTGLKSFLFHGFLVLSGIAVGILILAFVLAGDLYEYQDTINGVDLPQVDAIVCLAGGRGRIAGTGDLWVRYRERQIEPLPVLYFSGIGRHLSWAGLAKQFRAGIKEIIPEQNVILEKDSSNTEENATQFVRFALESEKTKKWHRILLVTSPYHMKRARYIFEKVAQRHASLRDLRIDTLSIYQEPFEAGEWRGSGHGIYVTLVEYMKWVYYRRFWKSDGT